jgi:hypothetical protein
MNHRLRMERLQQEIRDEQQAIDNCGHEWDEAKYDPEDYMKPYGSRQVGKGSDPWWEFEGYTPAQKDRWSRECKKCGKIQYTYTQEPIVVGIKPKF